jgi:hypothetical protein
LPRLFVGHMTRKAHAYNSANLSEMPTLEDFSADIRKSDREYIDYVAALDGSQLAEQIDFAFTFTDGVPAACRARRCVTLRLRHDGGPLRERSLR